MIASSPEPNVRLFVARGQHKGQKIRVSGPRFLIGREPDCHLRANSPEVSRHHAEIELDSEKVLLRDLGSRNGTRHNGQAINGPTLLENGDKIAIGPLVFITSIRASMRSENPTDDSDELNEFDEQDEPTPDPDIPVEAEELLRTMRL